MRVAVAVRIDRALEPRQHLVRAAELRPVSRDITLPARDANGQQRRTWRDPSHPAGTTRADDQSRHLRPVALEHRRLVRFRRGFRARIAADGVDPGRHASPQEGLRAVDAGVEQRDRHAAPVDVGESKLGRMSDPRRQVGDALRGNGGRIRGADGIHAGDFRRALEQREPIGVERGREAVDDSRVAVLGLHGDALHAET